MHKTGFAIVLSMAIFTACSSDKTSQQEADLHAQSDELSQFTLFGDQVEFFMEHEPLETGANSKFLVYVTNLSTYKPFAEGQVTLEMDGVKVSSHEPTPPGVFELSFVPERSGAFHATLIFQGPSLSESVEVHLQVYEDHQELHAEEASALNHGHEEEAEGEIHFLKEQAWSGEFMVTPLKPSIFYSVLPTSGEILAMPGEKKNVAANGKGMVLFASKNMVQGSAVSKGQHLFTITSETLLEDNFELQYMEWQNSYEKSRSEYLRHKNLYAQGAISERQFIDTRSKYVADSLRYHNLKANATTEGLKVTSPVSGTIHELKVSEGEYINVGQIMVVISSNKTLLIRADLGQQHFALLDEIVGANFRPAYSERVYSMEELNGRLLATGSSVAENDHYLPVMFEVSNEGSILEGAFTEVYLKTSSRENALVLPMTALMEEQGGYFVYVQVTGESYTKKPVAPGHNDGRNIEIMEGLSPGDRVVTKGGMRLKAASMVTGTVGHGHAH